MRLEAAGLMDHKNLNRASLLERGGRSHRQHYSGGNDVYPALGSR